MRTLLVIAAAMLGVWALASFAHPFDQQLADLVFEPQTASWPVDHEAGWLRTTFYDGPKLLLVIFGLALLLAVLFPRLHGAQRVQKAKLRFLFLCMVLVPAATGIVKSVSGVSCPYAIQRYGGHMPDENSAFSVAGFANLQRSDGCWPSGHVSGAFALLGLVLLPIPRRRLVTTAILLAGFSMGAYQVARGAHYASHIVVSLCIAIIVIALLQRLLLKPVASRRLFSLRARNAGLRKATPLVQLGQGQNSIRMPVAGNSGNQ